MKYIGLYLVYLYNMHFWISLDFSGIFGTLGSVVSRFN